MFSIIKASTDDCAIIHNLASRIWGNTYGEILAKEQLDFMFDMMYAPANIQKQMLEQQHEFFIIRKDGEPAGYLSIEKEGDDTYIFQKVYSLPELHGTGIGRYIVEQGISHLKSIHPRPFTIQLYVNRENPAVGFYKHLGFRQVATRDHHIGNGYFMNDFIMEMEINQ